jgi:hypothetical protein
VIARVEPLAVAVRAESLHPRVKRCPWQQLQHLLQSAYPEHVAASVLLKELALGV